MCIQRRVACVCVCIQSSNMRELVHEFIHVCDRAHEVNWGSTVYIPIDEHHQWSINRSIILPSALVPKITGSRVQKVLPCSKLPTHVLVVGILQIPENFLPYNCSLEWITWQSLVSQDHSQQEQLRFYSEFWKTSTFVFQNRPARKLSLNNLVS